MPPGKSYEAVVNAQLARARKADPKSATLTFRVVRSGTKKTIKVTVAFREIDVLVAVNRGLDVLAKTSAEDPGYKATRMRAFYAPSIYAPMTGLAFLAGGSTRTEGRHSAGIRRVLGYVMKHGGKRKPAQDAVNKSVGGNICSLTHNAGFSAMLLAQLLAAETSPSKLTFTEKEIRAKLAVCCRTLEKLARKNGGWQHGSPTWHLLYVALASMRLDSDGAEKFFGLCGKRLIANQQPDGSIRAFAQKRLVQAAPLRRARKFGFGARSSRRR